MTLRQVSPVTRRAALALALLAPVALAGLAPATRAQDAEVVVTMVTDTAGLGDQNFNDLANAGLMRAVEELGVRGEVLESSGDVDYVPNLTQAAEQSDLVVAVGFLLADAVTDVAEQYPDDRFLLIDAVPNEERANVESALFREQEGGFLGGVVAGLMTETNIVGILGGEDIPPVERYEVGFVAGARAVNPEIDIRITYADTFEDPSLGQEQSLALYDQGADIILPIAGATGIGTFEAAKEREGARVIAADRDQSNLGAEQQLAAITKGVDTALFEAAREVVEERFDGGILDLGLSNDGMGLVTPGDQVPAEVLAVVDQYRAAIASGEITVPTTRDELESFVAPALASPVASPEGTPGA